MEIPGTVGGQPKDRTAQTNLDSIALFSMDVQGLAASGLVKGERDTTRAHADVCYIVKRQC